MSDATKFETVAMIVAERDALAARCAKLHKALRDAQVRIWHNDEGFECLQCGADREYGPDRTEAHMPGCLAAPEEQA